MHVDWFGVAFFIVTFAFLGGVSYMAGYGKGFNDGRGMEQALREKPERGEE